jgi:hypothetical protein
MKKNPSQEILPCDGAGVNVAGMIYIAVGLTVVLVGADLLELTKRRPTYRGLGKLGKL